MEITSMLYALRDPLGVPAHPVLFLILAPLTWALHIAAVHVLLGASGLTVFGALSSNPHWRKLADAMASTAKVAISVAIVLGVAPLLMVQVIYDPSWYASNVLSAWWVIGFIVFLILGSLALFVFYGLNSSMRTNKKTRCPGSMLFAIVMFLVVGFIMHVLSVQTLHPEKWAEWWAPNGVLDASGRTLHEYNVWRFGFFIALSLPVIGLWLTAYRRYISVRSDVEADYLEFVRGIATKMTLIGGLISVVLYVGWMMTLPDSIAGFGTSIWSIITVTALLLTVGFPLLMGRKLDQGLWGYVPMMIGAVALIILGVLREAIRWTMLYGLHGYNPLDYKIHMDWYSTIQFFATFGLIGGVVMSYLITVAWKAGQTVGVYTPSPALSRLGNLGIALLLLWIAQYFGWGLWVAYTQATGAVGTIG